jgi:catechol 2,3-dioxygenase-like lactoylglutathione lyase family enzyme
MKPQLDLIGLVVKDMKTSLDFYRQLGLDIPAGAESEGHVEIKLVNGLRLAWDTSEVIKSFDPDWTLPSGGHRVSLDFLCTSPAEVDAVYNHLTGLGYHGHKPPFDAFWGQRYATIQDPDGNTVALFAGL